MRRDNPEDRCRVQLADGMPEEGLQQHNDHESGRCRDLQLLSALPRRRLRRKLQSVDAAREQEGAERLLLDRRSVRRRSQRGPEEDPGEEIRVELHGSRQGSHIQIERSYIRQQHHQNDRIARLRSHPARVRHRRAVGTLARHLCHHVDRGSAAGSRRPGDADVARETADRKE